MASKKKVEKIDTQDELIEKEPVEINEKDIIPEEETKELSPEEVAEVKAPEDKKEDKKEEKKETSKKAPEPKYPVGSIVFISKEADADLNGFKLFPPYKKYTYTVEAYDEISGVYSLRRLNLSLKLKEDLILAPNERAHDALNKRQY